MFMYAIDICCLLCAGIFLGTKQSSGPYIPMGIKKKKMKSKIIPCCQVIARIIKKSTVGCGMQHVVDGDCRQSGQSRRASDLSERDQLTGTSIVLGLPWEEDIKV